MKRILSVFALCALLAAPVSAGPFSLDNLRPTGAFDVKDDPSTPVTPAPAKESPAQVRSVIAKPQVPVAVQPQRSLNQALQTTRGACANGQCGRN